MRLQDIALLKCVEEAGNLDGRKRLQKTMFFLKQYGYPVANTYFIHYFGPYSAELAERVDDLTNQDLLEEKCDEPGNGFTEYHYSLSDTGLEKLPEIFQGVTEEQQSLIEEMAQEFVDLKQHDVFVLEMASTILYWLDWGMNWEEAVATMVRAKAVDKNHDNYVKAIDLAKTAFNRITENKH
ncbi:MAG: hypothetical protein P9L99_06825 [Candidatus Lernaella stagnicola]|nr:hypothetical protein [Candidatus Lernaella stagnicola]